MNSGDNYPEYKTDVSVGDGSTDEEEVAEIIGTANAVAEVSDTDVVASEDAPKEGTMNGTGSSLDGSTLVFLQKMAGVQQNFARQLETLTKKCNKWERRALYAEREVKAAEAVIKRMADLAEQEMNPGITKRKKSRDFKGVKNPPKEILSSSLVLTDFFLFFCFFVFWYNVLSCPGMIRGDQGPYFQSRDSPKNLRAVGIRFLKNKRN